MTRDEMLRRLGLTDLELREMLAKFRDFYVTLDHNQQDTIKRSLPMAEALEAFGPEVTKESLLELFEDKSGTALMICVPLHHKHHPHEPRR